MNSTCSLVHLTAAPSSSAYGLSESIYVRARLSWQVRAACMSSKAQLSCSARSCCVYLAPSRYPPGNMSFVAALARGVLPVLLGGFILTPQNRIKFQLANHLGFNHVTLSLGELTAMQSDIGSDNAVGWEDRHTRPRSDSLDTLQSGDGPCSSVSHHTASCGPQRSRHTPLHSGRVRGRQSDSFSEGDACSSVSHHTAKLCGPTRPTHAATFGRVRWGPTVFRSRVVGSVLVLRVQRTSMSTVRPGGKAPCPISTHDT